MEGPAYWIKDIWQELAKRILVRGAGQNAPAKRFRFGSVFPNRADAVQF
jgi:hypothetical protein